MTIERGYIIKGYLIGQGAPPAIMEAIDAVIDQLISFRPKQGPTQEMIEQAESTVSDLVSKIGQQSGWHGAEGKPDSSAAPKPRRTSNMSPENRTKAADRMREMQARKRAEREANGIEASTPHPLAPEPPSPKPFSPVSADRLLTDHNGYAGKRDPGQELTDEDWPDIKARLAKNPDRRAIASDYDVDVEDLNYFIQSCQRREQRTGEALASPSGVTSDATRRTW